MDSGTPHASPHPRTHTSDTYSRSATGHDDSNLEPSALGADRGDGNRRGRGGRRDPRRLGASGGGDRLGHPLHGPPCGQVGSDHPGRGHFSIERGTLVVDDDAGRPRFAYPLSFVLGARSYPIDVQTIGRSATLTPVVDAARSVQLSSADVDRTDRHSPKSPKTRDGKWEIVGPQTKQQRDDQDLEQFSSEVNATMTIASIVGLAVGAVVGGAVLGLVGCAALVVLGCVPGLIPGVIVGSTLGSIAGVIIGGGGGALLYAVQYFNEVNAPFKPHYRRVPGGTRAS